MPRKGMGSKTGGLVQAEPGNAMGQRTDLNNHIPIEVAPNQQYGEATRQRAEQGAIPMAPSPATTAPATPSAPTSSASESSVIPIQPAQQVQASPPGTRPFLHPTNRPQEPVTAGLPFGPGAGPEALGQSVIPPKPITSSLDQIAATPNAAPSVSAIADAARLLGL